LKETNQYKKGGFMNFKTSFEYELKYPFEYADNGQTKNAKTLTISAPRGNVRNYTSQLKELLRDTSNIDLSKLPAQKEDNKNAKEEKMDTAEKVIQNLTLLKNLANASNVLRQILIEGIGDKANCRIDGTIKLTNSLYNDISDEDIDNILGEYYLNFMTTSLKI